MKNPFTEHPQDTTSPQTYLEHGKFAFTHSVILVYAGILGIIHAIFPFLFPFKTSTIVIKAFKSLVDSKRHKEELKKEMKVGYILKDHMK
jgi:hypothetical protein